MKNKKIIIESPYFVKDDYAQTKLNEYYAELCLHDSLINHNEDPYASHLLLTRILDDNMPEQRSRGIEAGLQWGSCAELTAVYVDLGISSGMQIGISRALAEGREVEYRELPEYLMNKYISRKELYDKLTDEFKDYMFTLEKLV